MGSLGANGNGGLWGLGPFHHSFHRRRHNKRNNESKSSSSGPGGPTGESATASSYQFPLKQAATAASLALTGDTIAQLQQRWVRNRHHLSHSEDFKATNLFAVSVSFHPLLINFLDCAEYEKRDIASSLLSEHDWIRALRMTSYGFLLYGPGSYAWYQFLDRSMPKQNFQNLMTKVLLNQIVLGPSVIAVVFAWNNLWLGKLAELPNKYKKDALPTLFTGFRFWIPVSILNFWVVPLQARVAFMSMGSIFWNFFLSSVLSK